MVLSKKLVKKLSKKKAVLHALRAGQGGQALFEFSEEVMGDFYRAAHQLLQENKSEDAVNAFIFLVTLNPMHAEYWMGLGAAFQMAHRYESAIDAYEMAAIYHLDHPLPYLYLSKCLFAIHDRSGALLALELAIEYASLNEEYKAFKEEAENMKNHLLKIDEKG